LAAAPGPGILPASTRQVWNRTGLDWESPMPGPMRPVPIRLVVADLAGTTVDFG
jgi:hypothetical protein